ncbi:hypothetical protein PsorP6_001480 [Peronosclerospora sorghi]|uniref:Uncharacterized protein n=1 Tax=Peronosclerospora sorghi TaxID=230839 RepID=A0ACC0WUW6_9STRA|nr:hypothetical protein PsorP6_001480 [Peronosclerospora sorghi]
MFALNSIKDEIFYEAKVQVSLKWFFLGFIVFTSGFYVSLTTVCKWPSRRLQCNICSPCSMASLMFRSASGADSEGYSNNGFMNTILELFQRAQEQQHGSPPTSKPFLDKIPVKGWTQEMEKTENQTECVIFLSDYEKDDTIIFLPCGHTFHKGCGPRWLLEQNVCPTCRYQLPIQTEVSTSQSEQPTTAGTIAGTEPEQEPSMPDTTLTVTGVRLQRTTETFCPREVRQRVNKPAPVDDVVDLYFMLEQEADRFMKEEMANSELVLHDNGIKINDSDIATRR